jgi:phenylacetate-CoA ligase
MLSQYKAKTYYLLKRLKHSRLEEYLNLMRENQFEQYEALQAFQQQWLVALLQEANAYVPGYHKRLTEARVIQNGNVDLSRFHTLPPLIREDLRTMGYLFTHQNGADRGLYYYQTGGSTGTPLSVAQDNYFKDWMQASYFLYNTWSGLEIGTPYFFLWSAYQDIQQQLHSIRSKLVTGALVGRRILNCLVTTPEALRTFIHIINRQKDCNHIIGYAYELYALASFSLESGISINRPLKAVYTTAENLTDPMRQTIQEAFQCPVLNRYGCRELGDMACECEYGTGMHVNPLYCYIEVVDEGGNPVPPGTEGNILLTSLHNYVMPLIRYEAGDRGILNPISKCPCGRVWPTLGKITGRSNEKLLLPDGTWVGGAYFQLAFDDLPNLKRFQIFQISPNHLHVKLRSSEPNYIDQHQEALCTLTRKIQAWSGYPFRITFEQTDIFEKTSTGKELVFIQRCKQPPVVSRSSQSAIT